MKVPVPDEILPASELGRVHFIGIGGAGLSAIARIMAARGVRVSGSDDQDTPFLPSLREVGVTCHLGYAAADLVVCRAGASSVTEAAAVGLPAVFVPLPIGNGEQHRNARAVVDAGGALQVADEAVTTEWVAATVPGLANDRDRLATMGAAASALIPRDADDKLAALVAGARR